MTTRARRDSRNRPPAAQGQAVNAGTQGCPQQAQAPCDVVELDIKVTAKKSDPDPRHPDRKSSHEMTLKTDRKRRVEPAPAAVAPRRRARNGLRNATPQQPPPPQGVLARYDLVIEAIGDFDTARLSSGAPSTGGWLSGNLPVDPDDFVVVNWVKAKYQGSACATQEHAQLSYAALSEAPELQRQSELKRTPGAQELEFSNLSLYARRLPFDDLDARGEVTAFIQLVATLIQGAQAKEVEFVATSCGRRESGTPNRDLKALLRVFRRDKWSIGFKIPPIGRFSRTRTGQRTASAMRLENLMQSARDNGYSRTGTNERSALGFFSSQTQTMNAPQVESSLTTSWMLNRETVTHNARINVADGPYAISGTRTTRQAMLARLRDAPGFEFFIAWNGSEITGTRIRRFVGTIAEAFERVKDLILSGFDAVKSVELGWSFHVELSLFAGQFFVEFAPDYDTANNPIEGRYHRVVLKGTGKVAMDFFDLKIRLSLGVSVRAGGERWGTGITAQIYGQIEAKASGEYEINFGPERPDWEADIESRCVPSLGAVGWASVAGYTLVEGTLSVQGGLELKGKLKISSSTRTAGFVGSLKSLPITLTGRISGLTFAAREIDPPHMILERRTLMTFGATP